MFLDIMSTISLLQLPGKAHMQKFIQLIGLSSTFMFYTDKQNHGSRNSGYPITQQLTVAIVVLKG